MRSDEIKQIPVDIGSNVGSGIGVAAVAVRSLPTEVAIRVSDAANAAFMDAFSVGMTFMAALLVVATAAAWWLLPSRMEEQTTEPQIESFIPVLEAA